MKLTSTTHLILLLVTTVSQAFTVSRSSSQRLTSPLFSSSPTDVEALRAAAAKARDEADRLAQELGKTSAAAAETPVLPKKSTDEVKSLLPTILSESNVAKQAEQWQELKDSSSVSFFSSANLKTFPVSLSMLEQRTGLSSDTLGLSDTEVSLDDFKYATLYVTGGSAVAGIASLAFLPSNVGATLCYLFALIPIVFLGIGSSAPAVIANAIAVIKSDGGSESVDAQDRLCRHEAAHFCCGYWCGLPVSQYSVEDGIARVEFGVAAEQYSNTEVAALSVTALAGLVGEASKWEKAKGASEDLMVLEQVFRRSAEFIGAQAQQDITRWGALTAALLLKQHEDKYEEVVKAFRRQASIEDCIETLES